MEPFVVSTVGLIPFYGLMGAVLALPWAAGWGPWRGQRPAAYLNLLATALAFVHGALAFTAIWERAPQQLTFAWLQIADWELSLAIRASPVSLGAIELVSGITLITLVYALGYMDKDRSLARFYGLMGFFEAALSGIALSDSLFLSYALLEMLTLSTYLLVGFWYAQPLVVTAARDAFLTKRVGDIVFLMGVIALSSYGAGLTFPQIAAWAQTAPLDGSASALLGLALIAGPVGKCAQFPLNLWLDEAMEAPNPASILRNAIVVAAGAYVLIRLQPVLTLSPITSAALVAIGSVTAIGASLIATAKIDIKRTLAHSTSAYLGLVFVAVGLERADIALLLLFIHAIAKTLLFMSAGSVSWIANDQDITQMGGLAARMPATSTAFAVGASGLVVLLPLGNFWVVGQWVDTFPAPPGWLLAVLVAVNALNALNLTRVFRLVFLGSPQPKTRRAPEVPWPMALPMVALAVVALLAPLVPQRWQLWFQSTGSLATAGEVLAEPEIALLVLSGAVGLALGWRQPLSRARSPSVRAHARWIQQSLARNLYLDRLYRLTVVASIARLSQWGRCLDRHVVDGAINWIGLGALAGSQGLRYGVSGQSQFYVLTVALGSALLVGLIISWPF